MPLFRWLHRRGPTRSHPEHGSQALQSRWYCMVSMWESRSLPEFFVARIERALPQSRPAAVSSKLQPRGVAFSSFSECLGERRAQGREIRGEQVVVVGAGDEVELGVREFAGQPL